MFPSRGHLPPRSPAAYHLRPRRRPPPSAPLASRPTAPRPSWALTPLAHTPPAIRPTYHRAPAELRSVDGGGGGGGGGRGALAGGATARRRSAAGRTGGRPCRPRSRVPQVRASRSGPRSSISPGPVGQQAWEPCRRPPVQIDRTGPQGIGHRLSRRILPTCCIMRYSGYQRCQPPGGVGGPGRSHPR